ncbi:MAG: tRNA (adenosine(37)-N6)-threonylcarbamoyltransferase complex dimerization subunit type 1 TsaB [Ruminococcaceae bacterium]|nr:tRNA (adenosine(37)-N6)-threonylcarbamoyltransferase complex dimerization subunit type 1 TsaB [Oscillospiraceae bacterium]
MKILAVDSSAKSASIAVAENGRLISECFVNNALTHSRTLMPMVDNALSQADMSLKDIDAFCVNVGPGSFTGIRIGVAAVKGLAMADNKPCAGVSTLESIAYNFIDENCIVCAAMDARCNQVYTALFRCDGENVERICEDKAISIDELGAELSQYKEKIYLAGDGAEICFKAFGQSLENAKLSGENRRYQRAFGAALAAENKKEFTDSALLAPVYLRLPQAERELRIRKGESL